MSWWQCHLCHVRLELEDVERNSMDSVSRFISSSKFCWVGRLTDGKTSEPSGTEILLLLLLAPDIGEKVVASVIDSPSKHCLHIRVLQELLLQMSISFPVQPACMHSLLSFWILPDIITGNVLQLQKAMCLST